METEKKATLDVLKPFLRPYKGKLILSVVLEILSVLAGLVPYYAAAKIIGLLLLPSPKLSEMGGYVVAMLLGHGLKIFLHNESTILSHESAFSILSDIRKRLADKLSTVPMGYVLSKPSGAFKEVIMDLVEKMEKPFAHMIPEMTGNLIAPVALFIYMLVIDVRMAFISLISIPIGFLFFGLMMRGYKESFNTYIQAGKAMNASVVEYVGGIEVIKAFNQSASSYEKFSAVMYAHRDSMLLWFKSVMIYTNIGRVAFTSTLLFVIPFGAYFYATGSLSVTAYFMSIILSMGIIPPMMKAFEFTDAIAEIGSYVGEIDDILSEPDLKRPEKQVPLNGFDVTFDAVRFSYEDAEVLHGISFTAKSHEITAIVGPSGSGKSTVASLAAGFWDAAEGTISIGGVNVKDMPLEQVMQHMTYVTQDNFLFDQSIKENIRAGRSFATDADVMDAAKRASIHDFIMTLPDQYDSRIGSKGARLSGGEKQRVAIARAILKDAPIIILDEATAYTDPDNEEKLQASINAMVQGKTLIIIAHRLSTIMDAHKIIVIDNGEKVAEGTHGQLLETSTLYADMWASHIGAKDA